MINKTRIDELLKSIPGARKASLGIIFPLVNGEFPKAAFTNEELNGRIMGEKFGDEFHLRTIFTREEVQGLTPDELFYVEFCSKKEIIRLRAIKGAHDYLLRLRSEAIADFPRAVRVFGARKTSYQNKGRPWSLTHYYHSKDNYHKSYISKLTPKNQKIVKNIPAGLALIQEVNALCIRSLAGDVVVVSEGLEHFYYYMSVAFYGIDFGLEPIDVRDSLLIAIRIITGAETLDFDIDPRGELPSDIDKRIQEYVDWQMQFTFGHEYSHYLCGHLKEAEVVSFSLRNKDRNVVIYNHELEFEADYFSLKNIIHNKKSFTKISHGAFSTLLYLHFVEECLEELHIRKFSISNTHPRARDRLSRLHDRLGEDSPLDDSMIEHMLNVSEQLMEIIKVTKKDQREDLFTFHGSVSMSNYVNRRIVDRVEN